MPKHSKVSAGAYRNAFATIWIAHVDGTVNNTLVVFPFGTSKEQNYQFAKAKGQLEGYRGKKIREARFYRKGDNMLLGHMDENGTFHGHVAFMNALTARK